MHYLPGAFFGSKDQRNPQLEWQHLLPSACLRLAALYPHNAGKLGGYILLQNIEASDLAIAELRRETLYGLSDLLEAMVQRTEGVEEGCVFSMGEDHLLGFGVPLEELIPRQLNLFKCLVKIIYRSHSDDITSTVNRCPFP